MGENLSYVLRIELIKGVVYKQISWFDREDRAPGILTGVFSENITELNGMTSEVIVTIVEVLCSMTFGIVGGFIVCWQQACFALLLSPIVLGGGYMASKIHWGKKQGRRAGEKEMDDYEKSNALLSDIILNYRTVISLGQDNVD